MNKLSVLRSKASANREALARQKVERVKDAVKAAIDSTEFDLSLLNEVSKLDAPNQGIDKFAEAVATRVAVEMVDPTIEFLDNCKVRGLSDEHIRKVVIQVNELFHLTNSEVYEDKLEAVALYIKDHYDLFDDIVYMA